MLSGPETRVFLIIQTFQVMGRVSEYKLKSYFLAAHKPYRDSPHTCGNERRACTMSTYLYPHLHLLSPVAALPHFSG
ncbi:hypothetical protein ElyMa_005840400 [Elysia marginata]|uniref:Uncharacterized protein n=1 Tax=Elysia marginata TaxID=1093978 RepID=A0AAV4FZE7_9GAST|nr:hypothetical protein ElyMa_005840400 [Elysia marginata]